MVFKRILLPNSFPIGDSLTSNFIGIGFRLNGKPNWDANIEDTLVGASLEGLSGDGRVLSLLVDWIGLHYTRINADRLVLMILKMHTKQPKLFSTFWAAVSQWLHTDIRFSRLGRLVPKRRVNFLDDRTDFLVKKNGEDERFQGTCLRIPKGVLRHRNDDIFSPVELTENNMSYRLRVMIGPSYRADMWAWLCRDSKLSAAEVARRSYGSYPTAFAVKRDFEIVGAN